MDLTKLFIIYLVIFRLAIISAAVICIILGYKLFIKGIWPELSLGKHASVNAEFAGARFTLKNAAPGTFFALFGVLIISIMLLTGGPSLTLKNLKDVKQLEQSRESQEAVSELYLRSNVLNEANRINSDYENKYLNAEQAYKQLYEILSSKEEK